MENLFLVCDAHNVQPTSSNPMYRGFKGATYTEPELRDWIGHTWGVSRDSELPQLAEAALGGDWLVFQLVPPVNEELLRLDYPEPIRSQFF